MSLQLLFNLQKETGGVNGESELVRHAFYYTQTLENCVRAGNLSGTQYLLQHGNFTRVDLYGALHISLREGRVAIVELLMDAGANSQIVKDLSLWVAAERGYLPVVQYLIGKGARVEAEGGNALAEACYGGHFEVAAFLVDQGARTTHILDFARFNGDDNIVEFLEGLNRRNPPPQ